jgi:hypothetical protein
MHDIENGHRCPDCGGISICTIEDGACDAGGQCNGCAQALDPWRAEQQAAYDDANNGRW